MTAIAPTTRTGKMGAYVQCLYFIQTCILPYWTYSFRQATADKR